MAIMVCNSLGIEDTEQARLLYQGQGSIRIVSPEGKVIYIDPYAGTGYDLPANLILVTHDDPDHNKICLLYTSGIDHPKVRPQYHQTGPPAHAVDQRACLTEKVPHLF